MVLPKYSAYSRYSIILLWLTLGTSVQNIIRLTDNSLKGAESKYFMYIGMANFI